METRTRLIQNNPYFTQFLAMTPLIGLTLRFDFAVILLITVLYTNLFQTLGYSLIKPSVPEQYRDWLFGGILLVGGTLYLLGLRYFTPDYYRETSFFIKLYFVSSYLLLLPKVWEEEGRISRFVLRAMTEGSGYALIALLFALIREVLGAGGLTIPSFSSASEAIKIPFIQQAPAVFFQEPMGFFLLFFLFYLLHQQLTEKNQRKPLIASKVREEQPQKPLPIRYKGLLEEIQKNKDLLRFKDFTYVGNRPLEGVSSYVLALTVLDRLRGQFLLTTERALDDLEKGIFPEKNMELIPLQEQRRFFLRSKDPKRPLLKTNSLFRRFTTQKVLTKEDQQFTTTGILILDMPLGRFKHWAGEEVLGSLPEGSLVLTGRDEDLYHHGFTLILQGLWKKG